MVNNIIAILDRVFDIITKNKEKNIITGEKIDQFSENFDSQIYKISKYNPNGISFTSLENEYSKKRYKKNRKKRILTNTNEVFKLEKKIINSIIGEDSDEIKFRAKYNKNDNIDIKTNSTRKLFSKSSFNFSIEAKAKKEKKREKEENMDYDRFNNTIFYEIKLRIPQGVEAKNFLENTVCAQYVDKDTKNDPESCDSWYDEEKLEVTCSCTKQGLIVNIEDKNIAKASKMMQFPLSKAFLCKK